MKVKFVYVFICVLLSLAFFSCSSTKRLTSPCHNSNDENFYVTEFISRKEVNRLSDERLADLKSRLISQINTSLVSRSKLVQTVGEELSSESFSVTTVSKSFGDITNPTVTFCKNGREDVVVLSVNKTEFFDKLKQKLKNKIELTNNTMQSFYAHFNSEKHTYNKIILKEFENEVTKANSMYKVLINFPEALLRGGNDYDFTQNMSELNALYNKIASMVDVFDKEIKKVDAYIEDKNYKQAYRKLLFLESLYAPFSTVGKEIRLYKRKVYELGKQAWLFGKSSFYKNVAKNNYKIARSSIYYLERAVVEEAMKYELEEMKEEYVKRVKVYESNKILMGKVKRSEFFFGLDLATTGDLGEMNYGNPTPSFHIGFSHNLSIFPRIALVAKYKHHSNKVFVFDGEEINRDFTNSFNEINFGFQVGFLEATFGKTIDSSLSGYNFTTIGSRISFYRGDFTGFRNYINLHAGFDMIYSSEYSTFNVTLGISYHFRFNRKLNRKEKNYLKSLDRL